MKIRSKSNTLGSRSKQQNGKKKLLAASKLAQELRFPKNSGQFYVKEIDFGGEINCFMYQVEPRTLR